jgi:RimJ/RimL family protein N-acetyltransferase
VILRTPRLLLRDWREADLAACAEMTADPEVMRFFPGTRTRAESDAWVERTRAHLAREGFGLLAVEAPGVADFIGFVGLSRVPDWMPCPGSVEAVWTLAAPFWRRGYATEAAKAAMADGFTRLGLGEIVAFTAAVNLPSQGVMRALGMTHDPADDFDHPRVPREHPLCRHVLFRKRK